MDSLLSYNLSIQLAAPISDLTVTAETGFSSKITRFEKKSLD